MTPYSHLNRAGPYSKWLHSVLGILYTCRHAGRDAIALNVYAMMWYSCRCYFIHIMLGGVFGQLRANEYCFTLSNAVVNANSRSE